MKLTRDMVQRALEQHDKLVEMGVENTGEFDMYDKDDLGSTCMWFAWKINPDAFLL